jgi:hypothetical protein
MEERTDCYDHCSGRATPEVEPCLRVRRSKDLEDWLRNRSKELRQGRVAQDAFQEVEKQ